MESFMPAVHTRTCIHTVLVLVEKHSLWW